MTKPPARIVLISIVLLGLLAWSIHVVRWRPLPVVGEQAHDGYQRVSGVVHVHTTLSDGAATPDEVIAAARAAGLKFVVITDHNNLDAKKWEGYHDGLLVIVGTEVSTTAGHVLGLGIADPVFRFSGDARDALDDIESLHGVAFAAHPTSPRPDFKWTGWDLPGSWGLEVVNGDSQWRAAGWMRLARTLALYPLNHEYALLGSLTSPTEALARWDEVLKRRPAAALAGADAHGQVSIRKDRAFRFPSYTSLFNVARNHVLLSRPLTGDAQVDIPAIVRALALGRSFVGLDALAPADGFSFTTAGGPDTPRVPWSMGDVVPPEPGLRLRAGGRVPERTRLTLLRDGIALTQADRAIDVAVPGPGVYRVEARLPGWDVPWVVSNPISVFPAATARERSAAGAWPEPPPVPAAAQILDSFEGTTLFEPGADTSSQLERPILDPHAGLEGSGAARLKFHLGVPSASIPSPFVALVNWGERDLKGRHGLAFAVRGDGIYRIWIQVRDRNPASADEGTEWWFASVRTSLEWRRVAVPFDRLRSINPRTDGHLDLDQVRALVFVIDRGAVKPDTAGTVWLDDVGVY